MKQTLGELEHQVLLVALRLGESAAYSVPIVRELEARTGREVSPAAVYIALRRLERNSLVESSMRRPIEMDAPADAPGGERTDRLHGKATGSGSARSRGGKARRYFRVTEAGVAMLREARNGYIQLWDGLEPVLGGRPRVS